MRPSRLVLAVPLLFALAAPAALAQDAAAPEPVSGLRRLQGLIGIVLLLALCFALSVDRRRIRWKVVAWGLGLQLVFALFILRTDFGQRVFDGARRGAVRLLDFTHEGAFFLFGDFYVARPDLYQTLEPSIREQESQLRGTYAVRTMLDGNADGQPDVDEDGDLILSDPRPIGTILLFHVLPTIIFFSALMSLLYHLGVIQLVVQAFAWLMSKTMGTSGAESLSAAANIFVGQTEAPLVVRPFVSRMTQSELHAIMVGGFATVAGGVLALYISFVGPAFAGHLIAATVMAAPVGLVVSKMIFPETGVPETLGTVRVRVEKRSTNVIDAIAVGTIDGLKLMLNVAAMLLVFVAMIAMVNAILEAIFEVKLGDIFGWLLSPLAWCMGVSWEDAGRFGDLLGTKITINELVAYLKLSSVSDQIHPHTKLIATYALCGFANFGSIGIQIGGIGGIAPERRADLARLGLRAMIGGAIATCITASVAGILTEPMAATS